MTRKFWTGVGCVAVAAVLYGWRGLPTGLDLMWHGGLLLLGLGLMLPAHYFDAALATIRAVFGKGQP